MKNRVVAGARRKPLVPIRKAPMDGAVAVFVGVLPQRQGQAPAGQPQWPPQAAFPRCRTSPAKGVSNRVTDGIPTHRLTLRPTFAGRRQDAGSTSETLSPEMRRSGDNASALQASVAQRVGRLQHTPQFYAIDSKSTPATCWHSPHRGAPAVVLPAPKPAASLSWRRSATHGRTP